MLRCIYVSASGQSWHGTSGECIEPIPVSGIIKTAKPTSQTVDVGALSPLILNTADLEVYSDDESEEQESL